MNENVQTSRTLSNHEYLAQFSEDASRAFRALRKAIGEAGPLDDNTCELIALGAFATARIEDGFKVHARRLLTNGVGVRVNVSRACCASARSMDVDIGFL